MGEEVARLGSLLRLLGGLGLGLGGDSGLLLGPQAAAPVVARG